MNATPEPRAFQISSRLHLLLAGRSHTSVMRELDKIITRDCGLFRRDATVIEERQLAIQLKIDLLLEWDRSLEALAWLCLETEVNPGNVLAQAMKRRLMEATLLNDLQPRGDRIRNEDGEVSRGVFDWTGVAGMRELKLSLERDIILPMLEPEVYRTYKVRLPNGILLYGPPGCGKTFVARHLATHLKCHFMDVKPSDLASIYVHGSQEKTGGMFAEAEKNQPTIIFLDEIDAFIPNRGQDLGHHYSAEVNEFLSQLNDCNERGILVIGATNYLKGVDVAARRPGRFDKKIYVGPPDLEARVEAVRNSMQGRPREPIDYVKLMMRCSGFSYADLDLLVDEAARDALAPRVPIAESHFLAALEHVRASITPEMEDKMSHE